MTRRATLVRTLALPAALAAAACSPIDDGQADLCRSVLPAVEMDGPLRVLSVAPDADVPKVIRLHYAVGTDGRIGVLRCAFAGGRLDRGRLDLLAVEVDGVPLGGARLHLMKRFWLGDPEALAEGEARIVADPPAPPLLPVPLPGGVAYLLQQVLNALPIGAIYAFLAVAYALVYGLVNRIHLGFGEVAVLGSYATIATIAGYGIGGGLPPTAAALVAAGIALVVAAAQGALLGAVLGRTVLAPLTRVAHRSYVIATIGLAIALSEAIRLVAGSRDRWLHPTLDGPIVVARGGFDVTVTPMRAIEVAVSALVLTGLFVLMRRSRFGRDWRAVADDAPMAGWLGIDTGRVLRATFALSMALAAAAGSLTAVHYGHASTGAGTMIGLKALVAALLGGIGSLPGAAVGGLVLGIGETLWSAYLPLEQRDVAVLASLVVVLVFFPHGLFGSDPGEQRSGDTRWHAQG